MTNTSGATIHVRVSRETLEARCGWPGLHAWAGEVLFGEDDTDDAAEPEHARDCRCSNCRYY